MFFSYFYKDSIFGRNSTPTLISKCSLKIKSQLNKYFCLQITRLRLVSTFFQSLLPEKFEKSSLRLVASYRDFSLISNSIIYSNTLSVLPPLCFDLYENSLDYGFIRLWELPKMMNYGCFVISSTYGLIRLYPFYP